MSGPTQVPGGSPYISGGEPLVADLGDRAALAEGWRSGDGALQLHSARTG